MHIEAARSHVESKAGIAAAVAWQRSIPFQFLEVDDVKRSELNPNSIHRLCPKSKTMQNYPKLTSFWTVESATGPYAL